MGISLAEATELLLSGKKIAWDKYKDHKAGSITLEKPEQRRLFEFLTKADSSKVASGDETLFAGLIAACDDSDHDPANAATETKAESDRQCWRLDRLEAFGFGGLTIFEGKPFDLYLGGNNWCLEGQNGSGKTSLISAVLWALTGKCIREHEGPIDDRGIREDVKGDDGARIGSWPPMAAYPTVIGDLGKQAEVWVRLSFKAASGDMAIAYRRTVSPPVGDPQVTQQIDERLKSALRLAEIGVLMPARLSKIGFGKNSLTLYEAVRQLTGLDQLSDIADGCTAFGATNRKFMKYAKDQGIEGYENRFSDYTSNAKKLADEFDFQLPKAIGLDGEKTIEALKEAAQSASEKAGSYLETLKTEIPSTIDTATLEGRNTVKSAVSHARGLLTQGAKAIPLFRIWKALTDAAGDAGFATLPAILETAEGNLNKALDWHNRQTADGKLRLKALAAQSFTASTPECPLCTSPLDSDEKRALAAELEDLKANADAAEQKIADVCRGIQEAINAVVPAVIREGWSSIDGMNPADAYVQAMQQAFVKDEPFSNVLTGLAASAQAVLDAQKQSLPQFNYDAFESIAEEPEVATKLRHEIHDLERLAALVEWWKAARTEFVNVWNELVGKKQQDEIYPADSLEGKLSVLEQALAHARPLDDLSKYLIEAAKAAASWEQINSVQKKREEIKEALEPLKALRQLVGAETASSIAGLSGTINEICQRICLKERLAYEEAIVGKKEVGVAGSFSPGMRIDAALVANASWLRAILWSFLLALREQTLNSMGFNPLPLVALDDPQGTFDPRNKRRWAQELVRCANMPETDLLSSQLLVTTHERSFYQMLIDHEKFRAQQGLIGGVNKISGVATVANGGELERIYDDAKTNNDDAKAREYIRKVRIYCEDLIKFMLRSISNKIPDLPLNKLKDELKTLYTTHVAPFDRKAFGALIDALNESPKAIQYLNQTHHKDEETYGVAEADVVKQYWDQTLLDKIHTAFAVFDTFELYAGEPRTFPWAKNVIAFPDGHKSKVKEAHMQQTGVAAAAKTDGRAGDGILTVTEWAVGEKVVLPNHDVFQLAAGTLDPVAGVGDLIIVCNYAKIHPRNLVVAVSGNKLLARRLNQPEDHSEIFVLTGQSVDPYALPQPVIVQPNSEFRKIVGTLFTSHLLETPAVDSDREFVAVPDPNILEKTLNDARLFKVEGRSAEPIALEGQFLITRNKPAKLDAIGSLDGRLVVAVDEAGARYFKRLRVHAPLAILESLNPDGTTSAELLSLDDESGFPKLTEFLEVVGILFELPVATAAKT